MGRTQEITGKNFLDIANFIVKMRLQHVSSVELFKEKDVGGGERRLFAVVDL